MDQQALISDIKGMGNASYVVLDIEGDSRDVRTGSLTTGLSYAYRNDGAIQAGYIPIAHIAGNVDKSCVSTLRNVLVDRGRRGLHTVYHNAKYDLVGLRNNLGIDIIEYPFWDTMLMAHMIDENLFSKELDYVSPYYGGRPKNKTELHADIARTFGWEYIPVEMMADYSINDSIITLELFEKLLPEFNRQFNPTGRGDLWRVEQEWVRFLIKMEEQGIALDMPLIEKEIERGQCRMHEITKELGGNPASPLFLEHLLFDKLGLPVVKRTKKGKPSFDKFAMAEYEDLLQIIENKTASLVLEYRGYQKTVGSNYIAYRKLISPDGFLRPNYKIHGTVTSRLSCEKPNLQQIPRTSDKPWNGSLKSAFVPRPGYKLWEADYSNLELRIGAIYAGEQRLLGPLREGLKPFDVMAEVVGRPRQETKNIYYAMSYGAQAKKIGLMFGGSPVDGQRIIDSIYVGFPCLLDASNLSKYRAESRGYVKLWTGRRRHLPDKGDARKAFNAVCQGGAAEIVKRAGIKLGKEIDWDECKILLQVHDSYVFEIKIGREDYWLPIIRRIMEDVMSLDPRFGACPFPIDAKIWGT